jgi:hypothetical protein
MASSTAFGAMQSALLRPNDDLVGNVSNSDKHQPAKDDLAQRG